jgi:glutamate racemase
MIEAGARGRRIGRECKKRLESIAERIERLGADTLILGCTHFTHLEVEIGRLLPRVRIISPATVGAEYVSAEIMMTKQGR